MKKSIRRILASAVAINTLVALMPQQEDIFGICTKAYAADEEGVLTELEVDKGSSSSSLKLYSDSNCKKSIELNKGIKTYYTETTMNQINVKFETDKGYVAKAFKTDKDDASAYESGDSMTIGSGTTVIYVRTYEKGDYDALDVKGKVVNQYEIYVNRKGGAEEDNSQDKIYLKDITLSVGDLNFDKKVTSYDVAVDSTENQTTIKAKPEQDGDSVSIENNTVDDEDYKRTVKLKLGNNTFKIQVRNGDSKRTYTLNILRGDEVADSDSKNESKSDNNSDSKSDSRDNTEQKISQPEEKSTSSNMVNQWSDIDGTMKYYGVDGQYLRNTWFTDKTTGKEYYFYNDGKMATGWIVYNSSWYYMGQDGVKEKSWKCINNDWYYLDQTGVMKTGWFRDNNGKWYYFYSTGVMAKSTWIDGYWIASDGVWYK